MTASTGSLQRGLVALTIVLLIGQLLMGRGPVVLAILPLVVASINDVRDGTVPAWLLGLALAAAVAIALFDHRIPWLALAVLPLGAIAWKTKERDFGWGDVLALLAIAVCLPFVQAIVGIIVGTAISISLMRSAGESSGRMIAPLVFGAAAALWLPG